MCDDSSMYGSKECHPVINVKIEEICSACLCALGRRQQCSDSCCLFSEPSGMPAGVWARSVSASEIEVNWQALSFSPERVLGYEVHFTFLNGNRNHTQHNSNAFHHPCCTPCLHLQPKLYSFLYQHDRKRYQTVFKRTTHTFSCCC